MNRLEEKRAQITKEITGHLWNGKTDAAEDLALTIAMEDSEFSGIQQQIEEAQTAIRTITEFSKEAENIAKQERESEKEAQRLYAERDAAFDAFNDKIRTHEEKVESCKRRRGGADTARQNIDRIASRNPDLTPFLPAAIRAIIARRQANWERDRKRQRLQKDIDYCTEALKGFDRELERVHSKRGAVMGAEERNEYLPLIKKIEAQRKKQADIIADLEKQLAEL